MSTSIPHTGSIAVAMSLISLLAQARIARNADFGSRFGKRRTIASMATADHPSARAALLAERVRLLGEIGETIVAPGPMTYGSQAAAASQVFEQQRDLALRDRATVQLELVDAALARVAAGSFGTCGRCGRPIAAGRHEALPWAASCIDCQRLAERRR